LLVKRYLVPSEYSTAESWRLVEWCRSVGADQFTIDCLPTGSHAAAMLREQLEESIGAASAGEERRERMSGRTADDLTRPTELWTLDASSIEALQALLPEGIFQYDPRGGGGGGGGGGAWFEDPILYRDGELMLGVLSHEAFAVLRLTEGESVQLTDQGFVSHDSLPRIS
jgi:hypothetical protein